MTNDEILMTNEAQLTNSKEIRDSGLLHSSFLSRLFIRVIRVIRGPNSLALFATLLCLGAFASPFEWQQKQGYRAAPLNVPKSGRTGFTLLTPDQTGVRFTNTLCAPTWVTAYSLRSGKCSSERSSFEYGTVNTRTPLGFNRR